VVPPESFDAVPNPRTLTLDIGSARVLASIGADGRVRVERLLSTDPAHYLDPALLPGSDVTAHALARGGLAVETHDDTQVVDGQPGA
jgi:hypothetical protein